MTTETSNKEPLIIRIGWDKESHRLSEFEEKQKPLMDNSGDWGIYQIYGEHLVYGSDTLLYIGLCGKNADTTQTLGTRISQHPEFVCEPYHNDAKVYVGRLIGEKPDIKTAEGRQQWADHIRWAEDLLIFFHRPAYNSKSITGICDKLSEKNVRVFNCGNSRKLQGEVSSDFYREYNEKYLKGKFKPYRLSE